MSKPSQIELERAHACMQTLLTGLRQAKAHGGPGAKAHVGDMVSLIERFNAGDMDKMCGLASRVAGVSPGRPT